MKSSEQMDKLLKQTLSITVAPSEVLNQQIKDQLKENTIMKRTSKKRISLVFIAAALVMAMSFTAFAAWQLLTSKQYAEHIEDLKLAQAFEGEDAIEINKSIISKGYKFTLHGIVSGQGISEYAIVSDSEYMNPEKTYAVVSIEKQDGSKMPASQDEEYGSVPFFISPLIKGQKPWQVNIASMNGGYVESVIDGVMYRLIECDGVEMFADRGIYLCISTSTFYDVNAFDFNSETGELSPKADYDGVNILFDLPLNKAKADHEKAEQYLKQLLEPSEDSAPSEEKSADLWEETLKDGIIDPDSIKELTYDKNGLLNYKYEGCNVSIALSALFEEGDTGISQLKQIIEEDGKVVYGVQFSRDADGVIRGMIVRPN